MAKLTENQFFNRNRGLILAIVVFVFVFGINTRVNATEGIMVQQNEYNCIGAWPNCYSKGFVQGGEIGTSFIASTTNITAFSLGVMNNQTGTSTVRICSGGFPAIPTRSDEATVKTCGFAGNTGLYVAPNVVPVMVGSDLKYNLPSVVQLEYGKPYYISVSPNGNYGNNGAWYWEYSKAPSIDKYTAGRMIDNTNQSDLAFKIYYTYDPLELNVFTPIEGFNYGTQWIYFGGTTGSGVEYLNIWVDNLDLGNTSRVLSYAPTSSGAVYEWSFPVQLEPANYRARYLYGGQGQNLIASSTFTVATSAIAYDGEATGFFHCPIYNQSCAITASTTIAENFDCYWQKTVIWLLCPTREHVAEIKQSREVLQDSFPFSTIFGFMNDIQTALATSSTSTSQTFDLPMIRKTATSSEFYMMPVLSSSSLPNTVGTDNANMIRTTLGYFIWIMTGAMIFLMIKKT